MIALIAKRIAFLLIPLLLLLAGACEDIENPVAEEEEPGLVETTVDDRCEDVDEELLEAIGERLTVDAELSEAKAVESEEEDVTFMAAELEGEEFHDGEPPVGIWAVRGDPEAEEREILAVNAIAREHSEWPFDEDVTEYVDGGEETKACVDGEAQ